MLYSLTKILLILAVGIWPFGKSKTPVEIKKSQLEIPQDTSQVRWVRVSLKQDSPKVAIATDMPFHVFDGDGRLLFKGEEIVSTQVTAHPKGIQFGTQTFGRLPLIIQSEDSGIQVGKRVYRDTIEIWTEQSGGLRIVNELDIEDYLKGVLPWEANPAWPIEALKAQAVASRTYALFSAIEKQNEKFALYDDVSSQVYVGKSLEKESTNRAIRETEGQVLVYNSKIFPAFFHSTSGGATTRADYVWNIEQHPSLKGVKSEFSTASKHYRWKDEFLAVEIAEVLQRKGYPVTVVDEFEAVDIDDSGRARNFLVRSGKIKFKVHSNDFRLWIGPGKFKSTKITSIQRSGDSFVVRGYGWGHGVGMCQYSMKRLAELGYTYQQILEYFYPGSRITIFD